MFLCKTKWRVIPIWRTTQQLQLPERAALLFWPQTLRFYCFQRRLSGGTFYPHIHFYRDGAKFSPWTGCLNRVRVLLGSYVLLRRGPSTTSCGGWGRGQACWHSHRWWQKCQCKCDCSLCAIFPQRGHHHRLPDTLERAWSTGHRHDIKLQFASMNTNTQWLSFIPTWRSVGRGRTRESDSTSWNARVGW